MKPLETNLFVNDSTIISYGFPYWFPSFCGSYLFKVGLDFLFWILIYDPQFYDNTTNCVPHVGNYCTISFSSTASTSKVMWILDLLLEVGTTWKCIFLKDQEIQWWF